MIIWHQNNIAAFAGNHIYIDMMRSFVVQQIASVAVAPSGRIMSSMAGAGGLAHRGGIAGLGGGLAA